MGDRGRDTASRDAASRDAPPLAARARGWLALALPGALVIGLDVVRRGERFALMDGPHRLGYAGTAVLSLAAWALWLTAATRPSPARAVAALSFVLTFALSAAVQHEFFTHYNVYLALDAQLNAESIPWALAGSLPLGGRALAVAAGWLLVAIGCVAIAWRVSGPRPLGVRLALLGAAAPLIALTAVPTSYRGVQSSTPDVLYLHALRVGVTENLREALGEPPRRARFQLRTPPELPPLEPRPHPPRNVLVIVQEAVRADVSCPEPSAACDAPSAPTHAVTPGRIVFSEMRAVSSSTAVALTTMWTGLPPTAPREVLFSAPLLWDLAHHAGYRTAYWTSQHPMFANTRLLVQGAPRDRCVWATELDPVADYLIGARDELVTQRALADLDTLEEPFFAVAHYSNVHMPRRIDPERAPFQPTDRRYRRSSDEGQKNYYRNAVYLSELAVAQLVAEVRARPSGARTVILYLSDHGEAWFEHGQNNDHGATLFDEEIRIPAWIDAPPTTLTAREAEALREAREERVFQSVVAPTVLDLLGLWDAPALAAHVGRMASPPLTRRLSRAPEVLTNVSWAWEYGDPNWALMAGSRKLLARSDDARYLCFDVTADPRERHDLGPSGCSALLPLADEVFGMLPRELGRLRERPAWGWPR